MSFAFIPAGLPLTSSYAINALYAVTTSLAGAPVTASFVDYVMNHIGPTGSAYTIVSSSTIVP